MQQGFLRCNSIIRIQSKQLSNQIFGVVGNTLPVLFLKFVFPSDNLPKELFLTATQERELSGKKQEDNATRTPHIRLLIVRLSRQDFGRHEKRRPTLLGERFGAMHSRRETKVCQLDVRVVFFRDEQQVLGFHIAMGNVALVAHRHSLEHLDDEIAGIGFAVRFLFSDPVKEIAATHEFHNDKVAVFLVKEINNGYNVRVVETGKNGDLVVDGSIVGWGQVLAKNALDGDFAPGFSVGSTAYGSK